MLCYAGVLHFSLIFHQIYLFQLFKFYLYTNVSFNVFELLSLQKILYYMSMN